MTTTIELTCHYPLPTNGTQTLCGDGTGRGDSIYAYSVNCDKCKRELDRMRTKMRKLILKTVSKKTGVVRTHEIYALMKEKGFAMTDCEVDVVLDALKHKRYIISSSPINGTLTLTEKGFRGLGNNKRAA